MNIPVLLGTARKENKSTYAASFVAEQIKKLGHESQVVSPIDHVENPFTERIGNEKRTGGEEYKNIITKADAIVIVTPEYNHSFPGELKLMIDLLYEEYSGKPVAICGVSSGSIGGARAVEQLLQVAVGVEMIPVKKNVMFPNIGDLFEESGKIKDEKYAERVEKMINTLVSVKT